MITKNMDTNMTNKIQSLDLIVFQFIDRIE